MQESKGEIDLKTEDMYYNQQKRSEVQETARRLRRKFLRYQQAEIVYRLSHKKLMELESDAGAIYRMDDIGTTLATMTINIINDEEIREEEGILHHKEQVDLLPANIELSALEVTMSNVMSRELIQAAYLPVKGLQQRIRTIGKDEIEQEVNDIRDPFNKTHTVGLNLRIVWITVSVFFSIIVSVVLFFLERFLIQSLQFIPEILVELF